MIERDWVKRAIIFGRETIPADFVTDIQMKKQSECNLDYPFSFSSSDESYEDVPINAVTGRPYTGKNRIAIEETRAAFSSNKWATKNQWMQKRRSIIKGRHGVTIKFNLKGKWRKTTVFNFEQTEKLDY